MLKLIKFLWDQVGFELGLSDSRSHGLHYYIVASDYIMIYLLRPPFGIFRYFLCPHYDECSYTEVFDNVWQFLWDGFLEVLFHCQKSMPIVKANTYLSRKLNKLEILTAVFESAQFIVLCQNWIIMIILCILNSVWLQSDGISLLWFAFLLY